VDGRLLITDCYFFFLFKRKTPLEYKELKTLLVEKGSHTNNASILTNSYAPVEEIRVSLENSCLDLLRSSCSSN